MGLEKLPSQKNSSMDTDQITVDFSFYLISATKSLNSLQSNLFRDLIHMDVQINNTDEATKKLRTHISSSNRALVVLHDVDHIDQLDALFSPIKDSIHRERD